MDSRVWKPATDDTLIELLRRRARSQTSDRAFTFLEDSEGTEAQITYGELDLRARCIASRLQATVEVGARVLLMYPPGIEYIAGLFGCLYAGMVAVPAYPPQPAQLDRSLPLLQALLCDTQTKVILTTEMILAMAATLFEYMPILAGLSWLPTDTLTSAVAKSWQEPAVTRETLAILQYTSGSTRTPRGVMLSHGNLLYNSSLISWAFEWTADSAVVSWLPPYHDMGLIGAILQPLYQGLPCFLMSPLAFLSRPIRWLQAISVHRATASGGPNFAFDLCARKITAEQKADWDLSCWNLAWNGAEPVRADTMERFVTAFEGCGFRREAFYPCYGLAEATLIVSGGRKAAPPVVCSFDSARLMQNRVKVAAAGQASTQTLVGCGQNLPGQKIAIVDPESRMECPSDQVGEIWISGPSVAQGYWQRAEETRETFQARLAGTDEGPFLRTGDLGFVRDGELFVTGRIKDLIIIRGNNYYPQDIELTMERSHPSLRPGCGAAFSVDVKNEERLVVVQEAQLAGLEQSETSLVIDAIFQAVSAEHGLQPYDVVLLQPRSIPKTSSGKVRRRFCRAGYLDGSLEVVASRVLR